MHLALKFWLAQLWWEHELPLTKGLSDSTKQLGQVNTGQVVQIKKDT